ncbi:MAG: hypothetical protein S0880_27125 [Actinomycetota bacterium]|nr:hypothetical protein [Actinomycetota bacterium]
MRTVILDNEAVQALAAPDHRKHRQVLAHLAAVVARRRKGATVTAIVPTAVRVEAGWDRSSAEAAALNRFRLTDHPLDRRTADTAAAIVAGTGVSVADAHIGAVASTATGDIVVLTSDPGDIALASAPRRVTVVRI